jgi:hypothetical protein
MPLLKAKVAQPQDIFYVSGRRCSKCHNTHILQMKSKPQNSNIQAKRQPAACCIILQPITQSLHTPHTSLFPHIH